MIMEKKFLDKLKQFGLNSYEAKIWTALLSRGVSTAGELSDISNVPRSRSYDVLESLEKKGFIIMKLGKPIRYIAVNPSEVVERVKKSTEKEAEKRIEAIDDIKNTDVFKHLNTIHNKGMDFVEPHELSGSFRSREKAYGQMEAMIKNAEESVEIITTKDGLERKLDRFKRAFKKAHKNGARIKILAPTDEVDAPNYIEIRKAENIRARMCIVDRKEVAFMVMDDQKTENDYDGAVWINAEFMSQALANMFDEAWKSAEVVLEARN